jgi:two-component system response regulator HydG
VLQTSAGAEACHAGHRQRKKWNLAAAAQPERFWRTDSPPKRTCDAQRRVAGVLSHLHAHFVAAEAGVAARPKTPNIERAKNARKPRGHGPSICAESKCLALSRSSSAIIMSTKAPAPKARVLVVDDDTGARSALTELLRDEGYEVYAAADGYKALGRLESWTPDVVLTDLKMPGMDGISLMAKLRERIPDLAVIVMTAFGSIESAVEAVHKGADDYLAKPLHLSNLLLVMQRVLALHALQLETVRLRAQLAESKQNSGQEVRLVGQSKAFRSLLELSRQVADSDASVLIHGAKGTGKKEIARAMHCWSHRKEAPFLTVFCGGNDPIALEREIFGYAPGAFPGATVGRPGKLAQARGGTLYFDELGNLQPSTQVRLLRLLQEGTFERDNGTEVEHCDVRIIGGTSRNLHADVASGRFRDDLFYRIKVINLEVPDLRERRDDIPLLAGHFLKIHSNKTGKALRGLGDRALRVLMQHDWSGNIRELSAAMEHAVAISKGHEIEPRDLPRELFTEPADSDSMMPKVPGATLADLERYAILTTLEHVGGSTSKAAEILGISPRKIQYRLNDYNLHRS